MQPFVIAPSILSADFARLGEEVDNVLAAGADFVHFDVMDNHYVPNLTIGPMVCAALRKYGVTAPIDAHLMVSPVDRIVGDFIEAGATYITFHPEASQHVDRSLQLIREGGCKSGLVFNPATPLSVLEYVMDKVDMILLMSVNPGFGGQKFIPGTLDKLRQARALIDASRQRTPHQYRRAVADPITYRLDAGRRAPQFEQHVIHSRCEVRERIDQRAIQIEHHQPRQTPREQLLKTTHGRASASSARIFSITS